MNAPARGNTPVEGFTASREQFESVIGFLDGTEAGSLSHSEPEDRLQVESRALLRRLLQDHLDLRRGARPRRHRRDHAGLRPRPGIPLESRVVLL